MRLRVEELFHEVADLNVEARARYFEEHSINTRTRKEVEALVEFDSLSNTTLDWKIGKVAQQALAHWEPHNIQCGPYQLRDLLGRGGMGSVYSAERVDGEVRQKVAVKLLQPGMDEPLLRQRFLAERQILAALAHPYIARLLDAGHREDGQPYLVMEYIEGKAIDSFAAGLDLRNKVRLFLKVCAAVSYLHRNLVVHRDLKPANILVTEEGEPKLLDFGIAKMLDWKTEATVTGLRMLTPDYASPEQVMGDPVTTATDIYSLGAVLYKLLTGHSPHQFGSNAAGVVWAITQGRIKPPSQFVPALKNDLEMILLKALRQEPCERYATVEQFSEDLENYLSSRPIRARQGEVWYRARKFVHRHWLPVAATLLAITGLSGSVAVANHQRAIAQQRFLQVRQLANRLFDIDAAIRQTPGTTKARELIVSTSLQYLQSLAGNVQGDPDLAFELGNAYLSVARVQGVPIAPNLGHPDQAEKSLQRAEQLAAGVLQSRPGHPPALLQSARIAHDRMILAELNNRHEDVFRFGQRAETFLTQYEHSGTMNRQDIDELVRIYTNAGNCYVSEHQWDQAVRLASHAKDLAAATGLFYRAGAAANIVAKALHSNGHLEEALQSSREAVRLLEPIATKTNSAQSLALAAALVREGEILGDANTINLGRPQEAIAPLERAYAIIGDLIRRDPNDKESRARLFHASFPLAYILCQKDAQRALTLYDETLRQLAELPDRTRARQKEVWVLAASSYALRRLGRSAEAHERLEAALARLKELHFYPADELRPESFETLCALADDDTARGNVSRAIDRYEELVRKIVTAQSNPSNNLDAAIDVTRVYAAYTDLCRRTGRRDLASVLDGQRRKLWQEWDAKLPHHQFIRRQLEAAKEPTR